MSPAATSLQSSSDACPVEIAAAVRAIPFPQGVRLAVESGILRFARTTVPRWKMLHRGQRSKSRTELHAVFTDSSNRVAAKATLPTTHEKAQPSLCLDVSGDTRWPVGLADVADDVTLMLARGAEDALAALELWGNEKKSAVIAMLADNPLSPEALEKLRGRAIILMDFGEADAGFVFGGWFAQLEAADAVSRSIFGKRNRADHPLANLNLSGSLRLLLNKGYDLSKIKGLLGRTHSPTTSAPDSLSGGEIDQSNHSSR